MGVPIAFEFAEVRPGGCPTSPPGADGADFVVEVQDGVSKEAILLWGEGASPIHPAAGCARTYPAS